MLDCHMSSDYVIYTLPACLWFVLRWVSHPALVRFLDTSQCVLLSFSNAECSWKAESRAVPLKPCTPEWDFWEGKRMGCLWGLHRWNGAPNQCLPDPPWKALRRNRNCYCSQYVKKDSFEWFATLEQVWDWQNRTLQFLLCLPEFLGLCVRKSGDTDALELSAPVRCQHPWRMKTAGGYLKLELLCRKKNIWGFCLQRNTVSFVALNHSCHLDWQQSSTAAERFSR